MAETHNKSFARNRKPTKKLVKNTIRKQLNYVLRDLRHLDKYDKVNLSQTQKEDLEIIQIAANQQEYMLKNNVKKVSDRISHM